MLGEVGGELMFKIGEAIELRGMCSGDRKMNVQEYTKLTGKLDDSAVNYAVRLINHEFAHLFWWYNAVY